MLCQGPLGRAGVLPLPGWCEILSAATSVFPEATLVLEEETKALGGYTEKLVWLSLG